MRAPVPRILSTHALHPQARERLEALGELVVADRTTPERLRELAADASFVIVRAPLPDDLFERAPRMLGAVRHGAGVDMIPIAQATRHGVLVANVPGVNATSVAEYVAGAMVMLAHRLRAAERDLRDPAAGWTVARSHAESAAELAGRTVGIVGFGNVGRAVATICRHGFGMAVLASARRAEAADGLTVRVELDALLEASDFVVLAVPLTEGTRGLIDASRLARMRRGAFLVNVSRGAVVDAPALVAALREGHLGGAALDVFASQPLPADDPLRALDNVLLTPHIAGITEPSMRRMGLGVAQAIGEMLAGRRPEHLVNPEAWSAFERRFASLRRPGGR